MFRFRPRGTTTPIVHCQDRDLSTLRWYHSQNDGRLLSGDFSDTLPLQKAGATILLIPAGQVIFTQASAEQVCRQNLNWQFEAITPGDCDELHAVELAREANLISLAAVDRQWLNDLLAHLQGFGLNIIRVLPDALAVPSGEAIRCGDRWLIHSRPWQAMSVRLDELPLLQSLSPTLSSVTFLSDDGISRLTAAAAQSQINLLQGDMAPALSLKTPCRLLAASGLCLILSLLLPPMLSGLQALWATHKVSQQAQHLFTAYFPDRPSQNPARQFTKNLDALTVSPANDGLLPILADGAAALATLKDNPPQTLLWDEDQRQLRVSFQHDVSQDLSVKTGITLETQGKEIILRREAPEKS